MLEPQSYLLEVHQALLDRARTARFVFGNDTAIVAVQHMLRQTIDLFQTAAEMGVNLRNIFALGKVYSNNSHVLRTLRQMGITVVETTMPEPGEFTSYLQQDIERLWAVAAENFAQRRIKRVIVLDDAGSCITSVPAEILRRYAVCGIEQTSSGVFLFEQTPPPFAVVSWARTAAKLKIGGPIFAHNFIEKLNANFLLGNSIRGKRVGIIGFGSIGSGVANLAARYGCKVYFYDPDPQVPSPTQERITRVSSLEELMLSCDYVYGCSGRNPFQGKWPMPHRPGIKLFSVSGGDHEFGPIIDDLKNKPGLTVNPDTWDIVSAHGPCGHIRIAYLGYPYSFVSRGLEAVPRRIVQLETGGLLASLMQARLHLDRYENGKHDNKGIHRVTPGAQRFVYERWLSAMRARNINLSDVYGLHAETLASAQRESWFIENTEPRTSRTMVEEMLNRIINRPIHLGFERKTKPDLRTLRQF
jgi:hypothetical protein